MLFNQCFPFIPVKLILEVKSDLLDSFCYYFTKYSKMKKTIIIKVLPFFNSYVVVKNCSHSTKTVNSMKKICCLLVYIPLLRTITVILHRLNVLLTFLLYLTKQSSRAEKTLRKGEINCTSINC